MGIMPERKRSMVWAVGISPTSPAPQDFECSRDDGADGAGKRCHRAAWMQVTGADRPSPLAPPVTSVFGSNDSESDDATSEYRVTPFPNADTLFRGLSLPVGVVTLGQVAARLTMLEVSCNRCDRRGRRPVSTHGIPFPTPAHTLPHTALRHHYAIESQNRE